MLTCTCAPAESNADFVTAFGELFPGEKPATYAAEAYDAANAFLAAIKDGKTTRADINEYLNSYDAAGVTKQLKWDETGEVTGSAVYAYEVKDGAIKGIGLIE